MATNKADQTVQGDGTGSMTKMTIDNTHATGNSQFVVQKKEHTRSFRTRTYRPSNIIRNKY